MKCKYFKCKYCKREVYKAIWDGQEQIREYIEEKHISRPHTCLESEYFKDKDGKYTIYERT